MVKRLFIFFVFAGIHGVYPMKKSSLSLVRKFSAVEDYKTLGIQAQASKEEIKKAFNIKLKKVHPDVVGGSEKEFIRLYAAYKRLIKCNRVECTEKPSDNDNDDYQKNNHTGKYKYAFYIGAGLFAVGLLKPYIEKYQDERLYYKLWEETHDYLSFGELQALQRTDDVKEKIEILKSAKKRIESGKSECVIF